MKIYALAQKRWQCYGHGDYGKETIVLLKDRHGHHKAIFKTREEANKASDDFTKVIELDI